ncbi:hypothetical protein AYI70_g3708 [Smittium culicis]|uniref:Uncharacterized protein n=1 Tax=Smittium culicis TaxID=133412 RepID=A0A1R1Y2F6_9FUNG|nr:hypothetical protein AYI70_g3708 [Smittium culicis]
MMKKFAISDVDLYPWIVPRYSSFYKFHCCFEGNSVSIDINEYLFHTNSDEPTKSKVNNNSSNNPNDTSIKNFSSPDEKNYWNGKLKDEL